MADASSFISRRIFLKLVGATGLSLMSGASLVQSVLAQTTLYLTDFSGFVKIMMKRRVTSLKEAQSVLRVGGLVHPRGTAHSHMGKSMKHNAFTFTPEQTDIIFKDGIVEASAATTLLEIDDYLETFGYMLPTSPDHRVLSLGGVLSVGGFGVESCRYGALVDSVVAMDVLLPDGQVIIGMTSSHADFYNILCGLGAYGTILKASIQCVEKPAMIVEETTYFNDVSEYVSMAQAFIDGKERYDIWYGAWYKQRGWVTRGNVIQSKEDVKEKNADFIFDDDIRATRKEKTDEWVFMKPFQYNIWSDHLVPVEKLEDQFRDALVLYNKLNEEGGHVTIYTVLTKSNKKVPQFPHYTNSDYLISIGLYANYLPEQRDLAIDAAKAQMQYSKVSQEKHGALVYRYGWEWDDNFKF